MQQEQEDGNIEYKLMLVGKSEKRIEDLATQMRYRMNEGSGECYYIIGVTDLGNLVGLTDLEYEDTYNTLSKIAKKNNYSLSVISEKSVDFDKKIYEILVREINHNRYIDIKVAIAGGVDAGKSTMLSVLTRSIKDNGRGSARLSVFNYPHEVKSGRTSSIAHHILGFDSKGVITNYANIGKNSWPDIVRESSKVISFFDLCGHAKYLKTTILGLTSSSPSLCMIMVGANMGINNITKEHIFLCLSLSISFCIVITKIDICQNRQQVLQETVRKVKKLLKLPGVRKIPYEVKDVDDAVLCAKTIHSDGIVPMFYVSNVTGEGIDFVKTFLNLIPQKKPKKNGCTNVEYHIDTTFHVVGVGTVTGGHLIEGKISVGDKLILGPNNGSYRTVQVRSIHCKRVPLQQVTSGSYVCLGLKKINRNSIRRGNVILGIDDNPVAIKEFEANITVLKSHSTTIRPGYEPVLHTGSVRQTAKLLSISNKRSYRPCNDTKDSILRTGDKATVRFRFVYHPEFIRKGARLLMAEGRVKIIGIII